MASAEPFVGRIMRHCLGEVAVRLTEINYATLLIAAKCMAQLLIDRRMLLRGANGRWRMDMSRYTTKRGFEWKEPVALLLACRAGRSPNLGLEALAAFVPSFGDGLWVRNVEGIAAATQRWLRTPVPIPHPFGVVGARRMQIWLLVDYVGERRAEWIAAFRSAGLDDERMIDSYIASALYRLDYPLSVLGVLKQRMDRMVEGVLDEYRQRVARWMLMTPHASLVTLAQQYGTRRALAEHSDPAGRPRAFAAYVELGLRDRTDQLQQIRKSASPWLTPARIDRLLATADGARLLLLTYGRADYLAAALPDVQRLLGE